VHPKYNFLFLPLHQNQLFPKMEVFGTEVLNDGGSAIYIPRLCSTNKQP
jgi:hypothetical protein